MYKLPLVLLLIALSHYYQTDAAPQSKPLPKSDEAAAIKHNDAAPEPQTPSSAKPNDTTSGSGTPVRTDAPHTVPTNSPIVDSLAVKNDTPTTTTLKPTKKPTTPTPITSSSSSPITSSSSKPTIPTSSPTPPSSSSPVTPTSSTVSPVPSSTTDNPSGGGKDNSFSFVSFMGGMILGLGLLSISYVVYKFYKNRDLSYRTL